LEDADEPTVWICRWRKCDFCPKIS